MVLMGLRWSRGVVQASGKMVGVAPLLEPLSLSWIFALMGTVESLLTRQVGPARCQEYVSIESPVRESTCLVHRKVRWMTPPHNQLLISSESAQTALLRHTTPLASQLDLRNTGRVRKIPKGEIIVFLQADASWLFHSGKNSTAVPGI